MDIVDRLITRVELSGAQNYTRGLIQMGQSSRELATAQSRYNAVLAEINNGQPKTAAQQIALAQEADTLTRKVTQLTRAEESLGATMSRNAALFVGGAALAATAALIGLSIKASLELEKTNRQLESLFKGPDAAGQSHQFIEKFAHDSRRSVEDVQGAYITLARRGVRPTVEALREAAVLSDRSGDDMTKTAEQLGRAYQGSKDALKEYGVTLKDLQQMGGGGPLGGVTASVNDLKSAWKEMMSTLGDTSSIEPFVDMATAALTGITKTIQLVKVAFDTVVIGFDRLAGYIEHHSFLAGLLGKLLGLEFGGASTAQGHSDLQKLLGQGSGATGPPELSGRAATGGGSELLRQLVGGGEIARIGIRPSELPGIAMLHAAGPAIVRIEPHDSLQDIVNKALLAALRHGAISKEMVGR